MWASLKTVLTEALFTVVLVGFFASLGMVPFPSKLVANMTIVLFLQCFGKTLGWLNAGCHCSPAATLMLATSGKVGVGECALRFFAQLVVAPFLLLLILQSSGISSPALDLGLPIPSGSPAWIVFMEFVATLALLILIFKSGSALLADVGGCMIGGVLCPRWGYAAAMNPATTVFAALLTGEASVSTLACVGSLGAAILLGLVDRQASAAKLKQV